MMGIVVIGIGLLEFLLIFAYPKPTPLIIINVVFGILGIIAGIVMLKTDY